MKKVLGVLCVLLLVFQLSACGDQSDPDRIYREAVPGSAGSAASSEPMSSSGDLPQVTGVLTLKAQQDFYWKHWIPLFEKAYPGVTVQLTGTTEDADSYAQQTMVELMSGSVAYDLLELWNLPIYRAAENGLFEDLTAYVDGEENCSLDDLYPGIVAASTVEGQIASLPLAFDVIALRVNPSHIDVSGLQNDRVSFRDLYTAMEKADNFGLVTVENNHNAYLFFQTELMASIDEANKVTTVNSPEFITFLEQIKIIDWNQTNYADTESAGRADTGSYKKGSDFLEIDANALSMMVDETLISPPEALLLPQQSETASLPLLFTAGNGRTEFSALVGPVGIPKACENKELAWTFLRYFLFEMDCEGKVPYQGEDMYFGPTPVNRSMANQLMEATFGDEPALIEKLNGWFSEADAYSLLTVNLGLMNATNGVFTEYLQSDVASAEECARKLEEKIYTYFKE